METIAKFYLPGLAFLLTVASGIWLSLSGKPLNTLIFTLHKLIALGAVIWIGIELARQFKTVENPALVVLLLVLAGIGVVALFASGALMSLNKLPYGVMLLMHQIAPVVLVAALGGAIYLLVGRTP